MGERAKGLMAGEVVNRRKDCIAMVGDGAIEVAG